MEESLLSDRNIWDRNWDKEGICPSNLAGELNSADSPAWKRIISEIKSYFGSISNLRAVEIGAGMGRAAARLAREGAEITLVDFSPVAIEKAKEFLKKAGLKADFLVSDAFDLPAEIKNSFDISLSFGLVEHFEGEKRQRIFSIHTDLVRKGGMAIIGTPNTYGIPYLLWIAMSKLLNRWELGYERPFTPQEIRSIIKKTGCNYKRWGTPFSETINTYVIDKLNTVLTNLVLFRRLRARDKRKKVTRFIHPVKDRWSILDNLFGYHLIFLYK